MGGVTQPPWPMAEFQALTKKVEGLEKEMRAARHVIQSLVYPLGSIGRESVLEKSEVLHEAAPDIRAMVEALLEKRMPA